MNQQLIETILDAETMDIALLRAVLSHMGGVTEDNARILRNVHEEGADRGWPHFRYKTDFALFMDCYRSLVDHCCGVLYDDREASVAALQAAAETLHELETEVVI